MTVAELIEELQKYPGHHTIILQTTSYAEGVDPGFEQEWSEIESVEGESNIKGAGRVVKIVGVE